MYYLDSRLSFCAAKFLLPYPSGAGDEKCVHSYYLVTGDERLAARTGALDIGCRFIGSSLE